MRSSSDEPLSPEPAKGTRPPGGDPRGAVPRPRGAATRIAARVDWPSAATPERSRKEGLAIGSDPAPRTARYEQIYAFFMALFVTLVVLTNTIGVKLFTLAGVTLPVSILWYPLTFLVTDIVSEVYGATRARYLVGMGFAMSAMLLGFALLGIALPAASSYELDRDYRNVFGPVWRLLFGSMAAYLLAQIVDVQLFHFWKRRTGGRHLWLRNNGSTMISQLVDSFTVNFIFLYRNPAVFSGTANELFGIIAGVYVVKLVIAALDTPLCYLGVSAVERVTGIDARTVR